MKKFFIFKREYLEIANSLEPSKRIVFYDLLATSLLKDGSSYNHLKSIDTDDLDIRNAIDIVIDMKSGRNRNTLEYKLWRKNVFERDNFKCQKCLKSGVRLNAHHIVRWVDDKESRYDENNGITLCVECHRKEHL